MSIVGSIQKELSKIYAKPFQNSNVSAQIGRSAIAVASVVVACQLFVFAIPVASLVFYKARMPILLTVVAIAAIPLTSGCSLVLLVPAVLYGIERTVPLAMAVFATAGALACLSLSYKAVLV